MWLVTNPKIIYTGATVISIISTDVLSKTISLSLSGLKYTFGYMASSDANTSIKKYQEDFEILDIELKLKLIDNWLKQIDIEKVKQDVTLELIYNSISESCHKIAECVEKLNEKIKYHHTRWFPSWRSIYLDDEINFLEKNVKILDERIKLINLIK
jgi:hypothetical protein